MAIGTSGASRIGDMGERLTRLSRSVAGKRVIVTGAASGMGRATAHLFADEGARVAVVDLGAERCARGRRRDPRDPRSRMRRSRFVCDVSDHDALKSLVATVVERWGGIDVLINNAGHLADQLRLPGRGELRGELGDARST
jgi:3-oxoacyl-[acyl-carrier protein] reductase